MPQVKASAIRDMGPDEIQHRITELREELFNLRFRNSMKQLDNPLKIRQARREMARMLTVLQQKEPGAQPEPAGVGRAAAPTREGTRKA